jgi:hypothetical protein
MTVEYSRTKPEESHRAVHFSVGVVIIELPFSDIVLASLERTRLARFLSCLVQENGTGKVIGLVLLCHFGCARNCRRRKAMVVDLHDEKRQNGEVTPSPQRAQIEDTRRHCQTSIQAVLSRPKWFYASNRSGCGAVTGRPYRAAPMLCGTRVWCNGLISDESPKRKSFERGKWFDGAFDAHPPHTTTVATPTPNTSTARPAPPSLNG